MTAMRLVTVVLALALASVSIERAEACVQLREANKLLGWSEDGALALFARIDDVGMTHAEIHPTRFEGWKYIVLSEDGAVVVKKVAVGSCDVREATDHLRVKGPLTEAVLKELPVVKSMKLVAPPTDDGGASDLAASFSPVKRYAEHAIVVRRNRDKVVTLPVPVWCVGSCLRDEEFARWGATITQVAKAGDRTLYVVRMARVCNGGNDKSMWIERVIAAPGTEAAPKRGRCRGSG
jgi:hypothetical protein